MKAIYLLLCLSVSSVCCLSDLNADHKSGLESDQTGPKLLLILVDGFRWDYVSLDKSLKGFPKIAANGVHARSVRPIFPALSYPNWYSISTGLYAESHGMIQNLMYDQTRNERFLMGPEPNVSHAHWWNRTDPLWITAEKQNVRTAMYLWDGCQVKIDGAKAYYCVPYIGSFDFQYSEKNTRFIMKKVLDDFSANRNRLAFVYYELVDHIGHADGPLSTNRMKASRQIDGILNDVYDEIIDRKLDKDVNVVIVSDHGMTDLTNFTRIVLNETIDFDDVQLVLGAGSNAQILPKINQTDKIYNQLKGIPGLKVYTKDEIPSSYHYKNSPLVLPILILADVGYTIVETSKSINVNKPVTGGNHGYDPDFPDMHGIMYGFGPAFKRNYTSGAVQQVDHYNLLCRLLDIIAHPNNGSLATAHQFLRET